jgi:hypothetical protein
MSELFIQIPEPEPVIRADAKCNLPRPNHELMTIPLVLHGRRPPLAGIVVLGLGVVDALGQDLGVLALSWC